MQSLKQTLTDYSLELLTIIANRWDVDLASRVAGEAAGQLAEAMLDPERAAHEWSRLSDRERGALQLVLGAPDHRMPLGHYVRLYGDIQQVGPDKLTREKPHLNPKGLGEVLYYRGLVAITYDQGKTGTQPFVYVPYDLAAVLPSHETGYDLTAEAEDEALLEGAGEAAAPAQVQRADTSIVDDITTLMAYLQLEAVPLEGNSLPSLHRQALEDYLLGSPHPTRFALMVSCILSLGFAAVNEDEVLKPMPNVVRKWLEQPRTKQVHALVQSWQQSALFNELRHIPNIVLEEAGWQNNPLLIRETIHSFLANVPLDEWFSLDEFVQIIKEEEPDFQRSGAEYDSWYILDAETDEYLKGFESWDRVDGYALRLALLEPMHWLGLVDLGVDVTGTLLKLTAYGRAYVEGQEWLQRPDPEVSLIVEEDGTVYASRHLSRYSRFQLARFTEWGAPGDDYEYRLSGLGFARARQQGIRPEHILTFLRRSSQDQVPKAVVRLVEQQPSEATTVAIRQLLVLQTEDEATLQLVLNTPELRRYVGAQLGARAVIVRAGQWEGLANALAQRGIEATVELPAEG